MCVIFSAGRVACRSIILLCLLAAGLHRAAGATNLFVTGFEAAQGYNINFDLVGQNGWTSYGSGGNGLVSDFFTGQGQQAYIGFDAPAAGYSNLFVLKPIDFAPVSAGLPVVRFTTLMSIEDSNNGDFDYFQWHVYNIAGQLLFVIDFDVFATNVNYFLDGGTDYVSTGVKFALGTVSTLTVTMDFASNRWSASLNSTLLATNLPITTTGKQLTLGDVDAVWELYAINSPGDNFMLFDNYTITADTQTAAPPRPRLTLLSRTGGQTLLRLTGQNGARFAIEGSTNLVNWTALNTNLVTGGSFDYTDTSSAALNRRMYRARWVP